MRNEFAGTCYRCGEICEPKQGHFEKVSRAQRKKWGSQVTEKWLVQHAECAVKYRGTDVHFKYRNEAETYQTATEAFG